MKILGRLGHGAGRLVIGAALFAIVATAFAQSIVINANGKKPGDKFYLEVEVQADGSLTAVPLPVYNLGDPADPTDPTDPPPVDPTNQIYRETKTLTTAALADGGSLETAKGLSTGYALIAENFSEEGKDKDGKPILVWQDKGEAASLKAIGQVQGIILRRASDADSWTSWTTGVQTILNRERGRPGDQYQPDDLLAIGAGTEAGAIESAGKTLDAEGKPVGMLRGRRIFDNIDIEKLLRIILAILAAFGGF